MSLSVSLSVSIRLCRLLYAVWCNMMLPHNCRSRSSSLAVFTRTVLWTAKTLFVSLRHQCRVHMLCCSHRLDSNSQSFPLSLLLIRTCSPTLTALLAIPSSRLSVPLTWEHTLYAQLPAPKRSASIALAGTHNPVGSNPRTGTGPFPKPRAVVLPMVSFGQPKSNGLGPIATVESDLMHHQFRLSLLQWNPGPARRNPSNIVSATPHTQTHTTTHTTTHTPPTHGERRQRKKTEKEDRERKEKTKERKRKRKEEKVTREERGEGDKKRGEGDM